MSTLTDAEIKKIDGLVTDIRAALVTIAEHRLEIKGIYEELNVLRSQNVLNIITPEVEQAQRKVDALFNRKSKVESTLYYLKRELNNIIEVSI